jgi:glycosyltransferase involved in cell wall biosynthesis
MKEKVRLFFLIRSLNIGGAERQLIELVKGLDKNILVITVGVFYHEGPLMEEIKDIHGINVISLNKRGRWEIIRFIIRFIKLLKVLQPDILYSFLPDANIVGLIAGRLAGVKQIIWGVRASNMDVSRYDWLARISLRLSAFLSRFPNVIIANSYVGRSFHESIGYSNKRFHVIHNGINAERFKPDRNTGTRVRVEWGIDKKTVLIGIMARIDPMKDHPTFLKAVQNFIRRHNDVCFVCVGDGPVDYKEEIYLLSEELGLRDFVIWAGLRSDMSAAYNALDIVTSSSSFGEGFSNVIGEAMACGVPCVVTDVGDSAIIVGETGIIVPPEDPQALADGWRSMLKRLNDKSYSIKEMARARIVSHYNSEIFIQKTSRMFLSLL